MAEHEMDMEQPRQLEVSGEARDAGRFLGALDPTTSFADYAHYDDRKARTESHGEDPAIQVAQIRVKRRAAQRAHRTIRKRAAQELNP
jgi:hypothetical protein